jgi:hypothetical protein
VLPVSSANVIHSTVSTKRSVFRKGSGFFYRSPGFNLGLVHVEFMVVNVAMDLASVREVLLSL